MTAARLAASRRNGRKSRGPGRKQGNTISGLLRIRDGMDTPEYLNFVKAVTEAPPGRMGVSALTYISSHKVIHPLFMDIAKLIVAAETGIIRDYSSGEKVERHVSISTNEA